MALDATARLANILDSIKKYFVDNLTPLGVQITFDVSLSTPKIQGIDVTAWTVISLGSKTHGSVSSSTLEIYCCTRNDPEGFRLAQLRDKVVGLLENRTGTDSFGRIPFYQSRADGPWTLLGALLVTDITETGVVRALDETKILVVTALLRWSEK